MTLDSCRAGHVLDIKHFDELNNCNAAAWPKRNLRDKGYLKFVRVQPRNGSDSRAQSVWHKYKCLGSTKVGVSQLWLIEFGKKTPNATASKKQS
jgi:hypothetical protein